MTLLQFLMSNWPLTGLGIICIIGLFVMEFRRINSGLILVSPQKAVTIINQKNTQIIDIRSQDAFEKGYIARSKRLDLDKLNSLAKNAANPTVIISDNNTALKTAIKSLRAMGAKEIYGVEGGLDAWRKQNFPLLLVGK